MKFNNKKILFTIIVLVVLVFISILIIIYNKNKIKHFDIDNEQINEFNNYLDMIEKGLKEKKLEFSSEKSKNNTIYSMLIEIKEEENYSSYMSYNISLKDNSIMNYEQVANEFGYSLNDIYMKINERLDQLYKNEIDEGYVDPYECDIECYKSYYRGIENIEGEYVLYVKNNRLYIYINFLKGEASDDGEYFENLNYDSNIVEL